MFAWLKRARMRRKNSRVMMVMHPTVFFPKGRVFDLAEVPWFSVEGEPMARGRWVVTAHVDFVHIRVRPVDSGDK